MNVYLQQRRCRTRWKGRSRRLFQKRQLTEFSARARRFSRLEKGRAAFSRLPLRDELWRGWYSNRDRRSVNWCRREREHLWRDMLAAFHRLPRKLPGSKTGSAVLTKHMEFLDKKEAWLKITKGKSWSETIFECVNLVYCHGFQSVQKNWFFIYSNEHSTIHNPMSIPAKAIKNTK